MSKIPDIVERLRGCTDKKYPGFQNLNTEAADTITQLRERLDAAEKERDAAREYVGRWVRAMSEHYPLTWAMDPTNPELCIGNIVRFRQDQTDQLRLSNERLREALKQINLFVSGDARPKWSEDRDVSGVTATTRSRMNIGDICGLTLTAESGTEGKG